MSLFAQPPLRADAKAVAHDQHPDHQLRIDRRSPHLAVKRRQLAPQLAEFDKPVDRSQQVPLRHMPLKRKLVEQGFLPNPTFPHHRTTPQSPDRIESVLSSDGNPRLFQRCPPKADPRGTTIGPIQVEPDWTSTSDPAHIGVQLYRLFTGLLYSRAPQRR